MTITTLSSREFNLDIAGAKRAAAHGPVVIADRGHPSHVLLTYERYLALSNPQASIVEMLAMPEADDIEFEPPRVGRVYRAADLG